MTTINGSSNTGNKMDSPYRVMIVDDSSVIRSILKSMLQESTFIELVGEAENGKIAVERASSLKPDIILLDIEMPEMDGISALPLILQASPLSQVIMISTLTEKNASISIKALSLGAADYLQKPEAGLDKEIFKKELFDKIQALGFASRDRRFSNKLSTSTKPELNKNTTPLSQPTPPAKEIITTRSSFIKPQAIAIASSTGGPQALQVVFDGLKNRIPDLPIFITQHMPPVFTKYLANSISSINSIKCHEAQDGDVALPGNIYIAPGDFHMLAKSEGTKVTIKLNQDPAENFCRPSADPMIRSLLEIYGNKLLVVVLTGMGQDGLLGAKANAEKGGIVISQDKDSSVVWGMPGAVAEAGITSGIYPIDKIADRIIDLCDGKGGNYAPK